MAESPLNAIEWLEPVLPIGPAPRPDQVKPLKKMHGGHLPENVLRLTHVPWVLDAHMVMGGVTYLHLPSDLQDLILLVISQDSSCRYCYGASRTLMKIHGLSEAEIVKIESDYYQADISPKYRAALDYARALSRSNPRPGEADLEKLRQAGFSEAGLTEVALCSAMAIFGNRAATLAANEPDAMEMMTQTWYAPLMKPLMRMMINKARRPVPPAPFRPDEIGPVYAPLLAKLDGLPGGRPLVQATKLLWQSEVLSQRAKALVCAVVERSLGCKGEADAMSKKLTEFDLTPSDVESVLTNLASEKLTPLEARLVPLARDSVRTQPAAIQRKMRQFAAEANPVVAEETIMALAFANTFARLSVLLERH